tara:strand:- start:1479 stop:1784 length:306 start_codon:yes stop_codon:yes gene_type:complete
MANRYKYSKIKKDRQTKNRVLETTIYPKINEEENDIYITAKYGDRLDLLANRYYGNVELWWIIAQANHIEGTMFVTPGTQLRIPQLVEKIYSDLNNINNNL